MIWINNHYELIVAISAVLISIISLFVALKTLKIQQKHNKLSVKPLAHFSKADYQNKIYIKIKNYGLGPLIIKKLEIKKNNKKYKRLIDTFEVLASKIMWDTFTDIVDNRVLAPQKEFLLIQVSFTDKQDKIREEIRKSLAETTLTLTYQSIYNDEQKATEEMKWFARPFMSNIKDVLLQKRKIKQKPS